METPSSMRRETRSQASAASQKNKQEDTLSRSRTSGGNTDRSALLDITNDSPIVGIATGGLLEKTPSSIVAKNRVKQTPGSGEALLRGQVKTLLQKVDEGAELVNKISFGDRPPLRALLGMVMSPSELLAPTPNNTPQIPTFKDDILMGEVDQTIPSEKKEEPLVECLINRALLFDSPGKSEVSDISTISYQGSGKSSEDDNSSAWSLQVNTSIQEEEEEEEVEEGIEDFEQEEAAEVYDEEGEEGGEGEEDEECYDDLCDVLMKMSVQDNVGLPEFKGKHTRFIYDSDDEVAREEEVRGSVSPSVLLLKGLPVPEGKHLRFHEEEED